MTSKFGMLTRRSATSGTNSLPTLLWMLQARDSALKPKLVALFQKQPWVQLNFTLAKARRERGITAFVVLGADARDAVPGLVRLYERNHSSDTRLTAIRAPGFIGSGASGAVPLLLKVVPRTNSPGVLGTEERASAITALSQIRAEPGLVVASLTNALDDADATIRARAIGALGHLGEDSRAAVPALFRLLEDQNLYARRYAPDAIRQIDPEATRRRQAELDAALAPKKQ